MAGIRPSEEQPPWLEPVQEPPPERRPSRWKGLLALLLAFAAVGFAAAVALLWTRGEAGPDGSGEIIKAPEGPYKVKPSEAGGMAVEGEGDTAFATSAGADPMGRLNVDAVPEEPITEALRRGGVRPAGAAGDAVLQLGAFSSAEAAENAWTTLSTRFKYLEPLNQSIVPVTADGRTLYHLRASGPDAASLCGRLRVAGETCETQE